MIGDIELLTTDIIPLINKAWGKSFSELESNKKSIAECGWFPYNQNILMHKQICDTMTMKEIETDKKGISDINFHRIKILHIINSLQYVWFP